MAQAAPRTSLVVFGATGFTGKRVALEVASSIQLFHREANGSQSQPFTWAIAGRRKEALQKVRDEIAAFVGAAQGKEDVNVETGLLPSLVEADVNNKDSLALMASSTRLVLNCVGPYAHYGEQVVLAVIEASERRKEGSAPTHYIDLCGEPNFIERMVLQYRRRAKDANCAILSSAAYDSVPADMGTVYAKQQLPRGTTPMSVEMITEVHTESTLCFHYGTYASAINGFSPQGRKMLARNRKQLYSQLPRAIPKAASDGCTTGIPKRKKRLAGLLTFDEKLKAVLVPHFTSDPAVVRLAQSLTLEADPSFEPIKFVGWIAIPSMFVAIMSALFLSVVGLLVKFETGRNILLEYPGVFTLGLFSHAGPSKQQLEDTSFVTTLIARGFSPKAVAAKAKAPDVKAIVKVRGPEPGYVGTPIIFVAVARIILSEEEKVERGVSVPGAALRHTSLIKALNEDGRVTFKPVVA